MKKLTFLLCALVCTGALSAETYYIAGNSTTLFGASWDPAHMALDAQSDGTYSKTFTTCVSGKEYQFKITNGGCDSETNGTRTWGYSDLTSVPEGVSTLTEGDGKNNIVCTTYDANMTVVFDPTAGKITLTGTFTNGSDPGTTTYYMKHSWGNKGWAWKELTANDDGTYSIRDIYGGTGCNWNTKADDSSSKWISSPTLVGSPAVGDSAVFTLDPTAGDKAITITKIGSAGGEGGEGGTTAYYIAGDDAVLFGASWDADGLALDAQPNGTYSKTFTTCEIGKEYQFKITNGKWDSEEGGHTWGYSDLTTIPEGVTGVTEGTGKNNIVCTTYDANMIVVFDPTAGKITLTGVFKGEGGEGGGGTDPEPGKIVIKVQIPDDLHAWDYTAEPYVYSWVAGAEGKFAEQPMSLVDGWYTHTFDVAVANFIIVNGNAWAEGGATNYQSVNMENVTADACYIMGNGEEKEGDGESWKKTLTETECESTALQAVTVTDIYANNGRIYGAEGMRIYTVSGMDVTDQNGQLNGIYIVKTQTGVCKIAVK
ncbi:MAG: hypothetical protein ACI30H_01835 [Paludibacteraceae bacterium]